MVCSFNPKTLALFWTEPAAKAGGEKRIVLESITDFVLSSYLLHTFFSHTQSSLTSVVFCSSTLSTFSAKILHMSHDIADPFISFSEETATLTVK